MWARIAERMLREGAWDLGLALARWLRGEARSVDVIASSLRSAGDFGNWGVQALLGPNSVRIHGCVRRSSSWVRSKTL